MMVHSSPCFKGLFTLFILPSTPLPTPYANAPRAVFRVVLFGFWFGCATGPRTKIRGDQEMAYDQATQWLLDQMHDPHVSLWRRIEIAKFLIESRPEAFRGQRRDFITIIINGLSAEQDAPRLGDNHKLNITLTLLGQSPFAEDHGPARLN